MSKENLANEWTRHAEREYYYINEQLFKKKVNIKWIPAERQAADIFTKPLGPTKHKEAVKMLGMLMD